MLYLNKRLTNYFRHYIVHTRNRRWQLLMYLQGALWFGSPFEVCTLDRCDYGSCPFISSLIKYKNYQGFTKFRHPPINIFYFLDSKLQKRFQKMYIIIFSVFHLCSKSSLGQVISVSPVTATAHCSLLQWQSTRIPVR